MYVLARHLDYSYWLSLNYVKALQRSFPLFDILSPSPCSEEGWPGSSADLWKDLLPGASDAGGKTQIHPALWNATELTLSFNKYIYLIEIVSYMVNCRIFLKLGFCFSDPWQDGTWSWGLWVNWNQLKLTLYRVQNNELVELCDLNICLYYLFFIGILFLIFNNISVMH